LPDLRERESGGQRGKGGRVRSVGGIARGIVDKPRAAELNMKYIKSYIKYIIYKNKIQRISLEYILSSNLAFYNIKIIIKL
jgi:hypothetical protein